MSDLIARLRQTNLEIIEDDYGVWPPEYAIMREAADELEANDEYILQLQATCHTNQEEIIRLLGLVESLEKEIHNLNCTISDLERQ
jgi:hypothetical protein